MPAPLIDRIPDDYEVRAFSDDLRMDSELGTFTGHAAMFWNVDSYVTVMAPKAFKKTIADKGDKLSVLWFHDPDQVVGPVRVLQEKRQGLYHESKGIDDGKAGSYVLAHLRGGTNMGMSFGFRTRKDRSATEKDPIVMDTAPEGAKREDVRVITEVELFEISVLPWAFAANPLTDITSVREQRRDLRAEALAKTLEELRAGTLTVEDGRWSLLQDLVAAFSDQDQPEPATTTPLPDSPEARRRRDIDAQATLALAQFDGLIGAHA